MITRIEAYRYRCFQKLGLDLDAFQVFVGPNGAGKTTLLDIPILLGEMLSSRSIDAAFLGVTASHLRPRADCADELVFNQQGASFFLSLEAKLPDRITVDLLEKRASRLSGKAADALRNASQRWLTRIRYEIQFELFNEALQIGQEYLFLLPDTGRDSWAESEGLMGEWFSPQQRQIVPVLLRPRGGKVRFFPEAEARGARNEYGFPPTEPAFANVFADHSRYGASLWLRDLLTHQACAYEPDHLELRSAQPRIQNPAVVRNAATLAWLAHLLSPEPKNHPTPKFERWERMVRLALPGLERIAAVVRPDDKHAYLRLHFRNGAVIPASGLSDGSLSILALTILPFLPALPSLLTCEQPEDGIHPKGVEVVLEALRSLRKCQVFVSSHSPLVLAQCEPQQIVCLAMAENGAATATRGEQHPALKEWHGALDLGTLFASGVLG